MTKYLLTCECGKKIPVEASQSGMAVACPCGHSVEVPTMRELSRLKTAPEPRVEVERSWGWRKGLALLGLLIVIGAAALAAYMQFTRQTLFDFTTLRSEAANMNARTSWLYWPVFRDLQIKLYSPFHANKRDSFTPPLPPWLSEQEAYPDDNMRLAVNDVIGTLYAVQRDLAGDNDRLRWIYVAGCIAVVGGGLMAVSYFWPAASSRPVVKKHRARPR